MAVVKFAGETKGVYCPYCKKQTVHGSNQNNTGCFLTLVTCGLFLPFWLLLALSNVSHWECSVCGSKNSARRGASAGKAEKGKRSSVGALGCLAVVLFVVALIVGGVISGVKDEARRPTRNRQRQVPPESLPAMDETTPDNQSATREPALPGLTPAGVYENFTNRGFAIEKYLHPGQSHWFCKSRTTKYEMIMDMYGDPPSTVTMVRGTYLNYSADDIDKSAVEFLGYVASVPYTGSQPALAREWVRNNIGRKATTVIGGVTFELISNADTPRARILIIESRPHDTVQTEPDVNPPPKTDAEIEREAESLRVEKWEREAHVFTSDTGTTIKATIKSASGPADSRTITLQRQDGTTVSVPQSRFSSADQELIGQWVDERGR